MVVKVRSGLSCFSCNPNCVAFNFCLWCGNLCSELLTIESNGSEFCVRVVIEAAFVDVTKCLQSTSGTSALETYHWKYAHVELLLEVLIFPRLLVIPIPWKPDSEL